MRTLLITLAMLAAAIPAAAGPPVPGSYKTINGDMPDGRFSLSWVNGELGVGNSLHMESWDPVTGTLATEWRLYCASIVAPPILVYTDIGPDSSGSEIYHFVCDDNYARLWLSADGPWADGDSYVAGTLPGGFATTLTRNYLSGGELHSIEMVTNFTARFVGYEGCVYGVISATMFVEDTNSGPFPTGEYPILQNSACNAGPDAGAWGTAADITFSILGCILPIEETSWGEIKALYAE